MRSRLRLVAVFAVPLHRFFEATGRDLSRERYKTLHTFVSSLD